MVRRGISELDYRELQHRCKELGVNAKGKREELEVRLAEAYSLAETPTGTTVKPEIKPEAGLTPKAPIASPSVASLRRSRRVKEEEPPATPEHSRSRRRTRAQVKKEDDDTEPQEPLSNGDTGPSGEGAGGHIDVGTPLEKMKAALTSPGKELAQVRELADSAFKAAKSRALQAFQDTRSLPPRTLAIRFLPPLFFLLAFAIAWGIMHKGQHSTHQSLYQHAMGFKEPRQALKGLYRGVKDFVRLGGMAGSQAAEAAKAVPGVEALSNTVTEVAKDIVS